MDSKKAAIGSIWRKWDLHVHTPFSILNDQFKTSNFEEYVHRIINKAIQENVFCVGITDYFLIEGYKALRKIVDDDKTLSVLFATEIAADPDYLEKIHQILFLCNIEFRLSQEITDAHNKSSKIQYHVVFSDELSPEEIEDHFLSKLFFTTQFDREASSDKIYITKKDIETFGTRFVRDNPEVEISDPLFNGINQASVSFDQVKNLLVTDHIFDKKYLLILPEEDITDLPWTGQSGSLRTKLYSGSDCLFSSNKKTITWGQSDSLSVIKKLMPCLWGSDAHSYDRAFRPSNDAFLWVKSDVTFLGLQEALKSFVDRIFIGPIPPELEQLESRKAFTIKSVSIWKNPQNKGSEVWFDVHKLPLNPFLISIIGNRGSGKSALSDVIALAGSSKRMDYASFLNDRRFLDKKDNFGSRYFSRLEWMNEAVGDETPLNSKIPQDAIEKVQYLPQSAIENICNSLNDDFQKEVDNVVFSYLDSTEKLGATSLNELITKKTSGLDLSIQRKQNDLLLLNKQIVELERKCTDEYRKQISAKLTEQNTRLFVHQQNKPIEVPKPDDVQLDQKTILSGKIQEKIKDLDAKIQEKSFEIGKCNNELNVLTNFKQRFLLEKSSYEQLVQEAYGISKTFNISKGLDLPVLNFPVVFDQEIAALKTQLNDLSVLVSEDGIDKIFIPEDTALDIDSAEKLSETFTSLALKKHIFILFASRIEKELSLETQKYFTYLTNLANWEKERKMIVGELPDPSSRGSIKEFSEAEDYLNNHAKKDVGVLKKQRQDLIGSLLTDIDLKKQIYLDIYSSSWKSIKNLLGENINDLSFSVQLVCDDAFSGQIISYINQSVRSVFQGSAVGLAYVKDCVEKTDFSNNEAVLGMVSNLLDDATGDVDNITRLLGGDELAFLTYLTSLSYLNPQYRLSLNGRELNRLSPGEKGLVLLIFYLALSNQNCPLIIDQPEDNLDNQTIFEKLVPCIKKAKLRRQVIIVTHNPNIAVACDSEQIIYCSKDSKSLRLSYSSGSIENPIVSKELVDVLEGTDPAFVYREKKYGKK